MLELARRPFRAVVSESRLSAAGRRSALHGFRRYRHGHGHGSWPLLGLVLGLVLLADAGFAGTGRLVSPWLSRAPEIDGQIAAGEWSAATVVDMGAGVTVRIGNDQGTLYLAVHDPFDTTIDSNEILNLFFDDEGGLAPVLDDGSWANPTCQESPILGEGRLAFWPYFQSVLYQEYALGTYCQTPMQAIERASFASATGPAGLSHEMAIPLDGATPIRAAAGQRFAIQLRMDRNGVPWACLGCGGGGGPPDFQNLVLASGGCNTGPQGFGSGDPLIGLPLDWISEFSWGSGQGWVQSPPQSYGDPVFCQSNETGGAGAAACIANALAAPGAVGTYLRTLLPVAGQGSATLRLRAVLDDGAVLDELTVITTRQDGSYNNLLWWNQNQSATVVLPLQLTGSPLVELLFYHWTQSSGGIEGGYAQIDDVELLCGPVLFADGFQSGLTTHWSATFP